MRTFRWILVPALTLLVAGAAYACDKEQAGTQKASVQNAASCTSAKAASASAAGCCTGKATAEAASAGGTGACSAHSMAECQAKKAAMAAAHHDCPFCNLATEIRAQKGKVTFTTVENKEGITMVFAAVSKDDVPAAQAMANKAYALMSAPAHCSYTQAQMADKACQDCKDGMEVITHAAITVENTNAGAQALVKPEKSEQMQKLQAFFQNLVTEVKTEG